MVYYIRFFHLDEEINVSNIVRIFKEKTFVICADLLSDCTFDDQDEKDGILKSANWNKPRMQNQEKFDYFVFLPEDIRLKDYNKFEWFKIIQGNRKSITKLLEY